MGNQSDFIDPLPDSFETEEEAGAFWDTHSTVDYEQYLEPAEELSIDSTLTDGER